MSEDIHYILGHPEISESDLEFIFKFYHSICRFYHEDSYEFKEICYKIKNAFSYEQIKYYDLSADYYIETYNGSEVLCIKNHIQHAVSYLVYKYFGEKEYSDLERHKFRYIDGNPWNNDIDNIEVI